MGTCVNVRVIEYLCYVIGLSSHPHNRQQCSYSGCKNIPSVWAQILSPLRMACSYYFLLGWQILWATTEQWDGKKGRVWTNSFNPNRLREIGLNWLNLGPHGFVSISSRCLIICLFSSRCTHLCTAQTKWDTSILHKQHSYLHIFFCIAQCYFYYRKHLKFEGCACV